MPALTALGDLLILTMATEPFHRGGLNQVSVRADDGREGTAVFEVTGARHHRCFPDCTLPGVLPS